MTNIIRAIFGRKKTDSAPARDVKSLIRGMARDAIQLVKAGGASRSYLGGDPGLPPEAQWPQRDGNPLGFLARISLSELQTQLPTSWLPDQGALLFFYDDKKQPWGFDPKDRGGWVVLRVPDIEPITPRPFRRIEGLLPHRLVTLTPIAVLPSHERPEVQALELSEAEFDLLYEEADLRFKDLPKHQLLGLPSPIQGDSMELECQLASNGIYCGDAEGSRTPLAKSLEPGAENWRLLLQLDTDDDLGVMWGDGGILYFWVEEEAAREGRFDNTWLVLQCT